MADIRILSNGVTLVAERDPHSLSAAYGVFIRAGSCLEHPEQHGISHLIEHMAFKATKGLSGQQIARAIDDLGGDLNAYTSKEFTVFYSRVLPHRGQAALRLLADLALQPRFDGQDLSRERQVVVEEIRLLEDAPDELVHDLLEGTVFRGHALSSPVLGRVENVLAFEPSDMLDFYRAHYHGANTVVSAAGAIDTQQFFDQAQLLFSAMPPGQAVTPVAAPTPSRGMEIRERSSGELHVTIGGQAVPLSDPTVYAMQLLLAIMGGGPSSRLFQRLREEAGISYSVYSYDALYSVAGMFGVYLDLAPESLRQAITMVGEVLTSLRLRPADAEELHRAKEQVSAGFILGLETTYNRMERNGASLLLLGRIPTVEEVLAKIREVSAEQVQAVAELLLKPERLSMAAVGPWPEEVTVEDWTFLS